MSASIKAYTPSDPRLVDMTSDELLTELYRYSFPSLMAMESSGLWHAQCTMRIKTQGAQFKVASEFNHPTPKAALVVLLDLVQKAVAEIGGGNG